MNISRPQFDHLRFDPKISLIKNSDYLRCEMKFKAMVSPPDLNFDKFILSVTCTFAFYTEENIEDVASYLGVVASVVENGTGFVNDRKSLIHLSTLFYQGFITYIESEAPYLGMGFLSPPNHEEVADSWVKILSEQGFYKS